MPASPSRRRLLASLGAGVATTLAGCTSPDTDPPDDDDATRITEYTAVTARSTVDRPAVVVPTTSRDDGTAAETTPQPEPVETTAIGRRAAATELRFTPATTNVTAARRLLAETDFESESVFVYQTRISECYRLRLDAVSRSAHGDPDLDFCQVIRDAHTACEREATDYVAALVRLPVPATEYDGFSVSSGGRCDPSPEPTGSESP